jgi:hypothetical protein
VLYKELIGNPRALWDYLCGLIDNEGRKVASVTEAAAALHWNVDTTMSAALDLYADSLIELSDGAERITVRDEGIAYKEGLKREKEKLWVCPWCRKQDNQRDAHAAHLKVCEGRPKIKGGMGIT